MKDDGKISLSENDSHADYITRLLFTRECQHSPCHPGIFLLQIAPDRVRDGVGVVAGGALVGVGEDATDAVARGGGGRALANQAADFEFKPKANYVLIGTAL